MTSESSILGSAGPKVDSDADNIYIDLDCLLDTRLGTLSKVSTELATVALRNNYSNRYNDRFEGITREAFDAEYTKRDIETLKHSVLTNSVFFIQRLIKDGLLSAAIHAKVENLCFTVNIYPYVMEDTEMIDMLIACIRFYTFSTATVTIVSFNNAELAPSYCREHFQIMIRYHWLEWVDTHKTFFETTGVPQLVLVVPELFVDEIPTKEQLTNLGLKNVNPFDETAKATAALFRLKFMPVSMFSIHEKITAQTAQAVVNRVSVTEEDILNHLDKHHPTAELVREDPLPVVDLDDAFQLF